VIKALASTVDGLEVASGGELELARQAGVRRVAFGGPAKTDAELACAVEAGATINLESLLEIRRLAARAGVGWPVRVALRVNRATAMLPGSHQMTGTPTPFGIDEEQLPEAVARVSEEPALDLVGFHLHAVSNNLDAVAHGAVRHRGGGSGRGAWPAGTASGCARSTWAVASAWTTSATDGSTWRSCAPHCPPARHWYSNWADN